MDDCGDAKMTAPQIGDAKMTVSSAIGLSIEDVRTWEASLAEVQAVYPLVLRVGDKVLRLTGDDVADLVDERGVHDPLPAYRTIGEPDS